ncbi:MAG: hypothetical protein J1F28_05840 [Oscillospiraceae bacterium]|nr:hypothetical protein [Oscillospiraceae bacterium]
MKITSKIFAGVFAAAVMSTAAVASVSAETYGDAETTDIIPGDYIEKEDGDKITYADITNSSAWKYSDGKVTLTINDNTKLPKDLVKILKDKVAEVSGDVAVKLVGDGFTVELSKSQVANIPDAGFDFNMNIAEIENKSLLKEAGYAEVPAKALYILPTATGKFNDGKLSFKVTIDGLSTSTFTNKDTKFYYVNSETGKVENANYTYKDGKLTVTLNHASYYVLSPKEIKGAVASTAPSTPSGTNSGNNSGSGNTTNPDTGVALPIALVALAGGSVAVSAIVAKKRK